MVHTGNPEKDLRKYRLATLAYLKEVEKKKEQARKEIERRRRLQGMKLEGLISCTFRISY